MKKLLLICLFLVATCSLAFADVYILYNTETKEVQSVSNQDDAVLENGYTKIILDGDISEYPLVYGAQNYKFVNNRFISNTKKISDEENAKIISKEKSIENKMIQDKLSEMAVVELKKEGKTFKYH